ncbi:hypothetical protein J7T55_015699 [Diaporthe amygdali]|uniref:uncharacterized protein n=1 Tax=Phomopsis amygdali TaxID=1214568 RepID=UPI0022FECC0D|nr:uncharacterized protein J7T55_015699 [Diaporthe amygdali]KAJ0120960.1 hypothetical protein J7T55_015699 [Diaporthe amygdali]
MQNFSLIRRGTGNAVLEPTKIPTLRDDYVLVKTVAVALNPTDWTTLDAVGDDGTIVGCDYAGIVEDVGRDAAQHFRKGDRIAGFGHGGNDANPENGVFARYIAVKAGLQIHIPDDVSFEAASTVGVGVGSAGYGLYHVLNLQLPDAESNSHGESILIYGGSTATGAVAIQFAKLQVHRKKYYWIRISAKIHRSGYNVVTTCSPRNFDYVKKLGADIVFDYVCNFVSSPFLIVERVMNGLTFTKRAPDVGKSIFEATRGSLTKVFDTVNTSDSAEICAAAFGPDGGKYCNLLGVECPRSDVESVFFLGYDMSGEAYIFEGDSYPAKPDAFEFGRTWYSIAEKLWASGKWQNHRQNVGEKGLLGVLDGMQLMRQGLVSGEKLVYRVEETEWPNPA